MHELFEGLSNFVPEVKAELKRLGTQGSMELANALFNGSGFVPYGTGQNPPEIELPGQQQTIEGLQRENEGIER